MTARQFRRDLAVAAGAAVVALGGALTAPQGRTPLDALGFVLLLVPAVVLLGRERAPRTVLLIGAACVIAYPAVGYPGIGPAAPVFVAIYTLAAGGRRRFAGTVVAVVVIGGLAVERAVLGDGAVPEIGQRWILLAGWMVASGVLADVLRQHRAYLRLAEERAAEAERTREETARRRADEERVRIARDLHDSLTHTISIIKVQAGVAVHLAGKRGEPVPPALAAIQEAATEAMRELRATLEVLRADDRPGCGLDGLPKLVAGARRAGVPVTVSLAGEPRELPRPVDAAAYRIVQEALTNVGRHAGAAEAAVRIEYAEQALTVEITDDGAGPGAEAVPGHGLAGMRERVSALGGTLVTGAGPDRGFTVRAVLPLALTGQPVIGEPA